MNEEEQELRKNLSDRGLNEDQINQIFNLKPISGSPSIDSSIEKIESILNTANLGVNQTNEVQNGNDPNKPALPTMLANIKFSESSESALIPKMFDKQTQLNLLKSSIKDVKDKNIIDSVKKSISDIESSVTILEKIKTFFSK